MTETRSLSISGVRAWCRMFMYLNIYRNSVSVCHYVYASVQEVEGAASHGVFCGMSLLGPSQSHEMGKHEIKVEKTHKRVEGG